MFTLCRIKQKTDDVKSAFGAASAALKAMQLQKELQKEMEGRLSKQNNTGGSSISPEPGSPSRDEDEKSKKTKQTIQESIDAESMQRTLPIMLDAMWAANVVDIQSIVVRACHQVRRSAFVFKIK